MNIEQKRITNPAWQKWEPYVSDRLVEVSRRGNRQQPQFELTDTGIFYEDTVSVIRSMK